jgi:hypothetical protein
MRSAESRAASAVLAAPARAAFANDRRKRRAPPFFLFLRLVLCAKENPADSRDCVRAWEPTRTELSPARRVEMPDSAPTVQMDTLGMAQVRLKSREFGRICAIH